MRRIVSVLPLVVLIVASAALAAAQQEGTPAPLVPQVVTIAPPDGQVLPTPAVSPTPATAQDPAALPILLGVRSDLEALANNVLGDGVRPDGWSGSLDLNDPALSVVMRLDLELLAAATVGAAQRPDGWFGAVASTPFAIARDVRHDLELLADTLLTLNVRPVGWEGSDPLLRCDRDTQALVNLMEAAGYRMQADLNAPDFCALVAVEVSLIVERAMLDGTSLQLIAPLTDEATGAG